MKRKLIVIISVVAALTFLSASQPSSKEKIKSSSISPNIVNSAISINDWDTLHIAAQSWLNKEPNSIAHVILGYCYLKNGDYNHASEHFAHINAADLDNHLILAEELVEQFPNSTISYLFRGDAYARKGNYQEAINDFSVVITNSTNLTIGYSIRALIHYFNKDIERAFKDLNLALQYASDVAKAEVYYNRGIIHCIKGDLERAIQDFSNAINFSQNFAAAYNAHGVAKFLAGELDQAIKDFQAALQIDQGFGQARVNLQLAMQQKAKGRLSKAIACVRQDYRSGLLSAQYNLGVFGTGIRSEADLNYAISHANSIPSNRENAFLYVGFKGNFPLAGFNKVRQRNDFQTILVNPKNPEQGFKAINKFVNHAVSMGKNPMVFIDMNKWVPAQLGNWSSKTTDIPAQFAASANNAFHNQVNKLGARGISSIYGHSDFSYPALKATEIATKQNTPFNFAGIESPRSEKWLQNAISTSPKTHFVAVLPSSGDFWTKEAQGRALRGDFAGAYQKTLQGLRGIKAPNYQFLEIMNPTKANGIIKLAGNAHGDAANMNRWSNVDIWQGGKKQGSHMSTLGDLYRMEMNKLSNTGYQKIQKQLNSPITASGLQPKGILIDIKSESYQMNRKRANVQSLLYADNLDTKYSKPVEGTLRADFLVFTGTQNDVRKP